MSQKYAMIGGWWIRNSEQSFWLRIGGGAWVEQALDHNLDLGSTGGYAYPTGDGNGDDALFMLNATLNAAISAYPGWASSYVLLDIPDQDTGILRLRWYDLDGLGTLEIAFDHPTLPAANKNSYFLHDLLRMTSSPTGVISLATGNPTTRVGDRCHGYAFYPARYMMTDLDEYEARVSQAVPDVGTPQTLRTSMRRKHRIGIRMDIAYPRAAVFNEYHQLADFMDKAASGAPFRLYPDRNNIIGGAPYADATQPWGYSTYVMDKDSASWRPEPPSGNWYKVLDTSLLAWEI